MPLYGTDPVKPIDYQEYVQRQEELAKQMFDQQDRQANYNAKAAQNDGLNNLLLAQYKKFEKGSEDLKNG